MSINRFNNMMPRLNKLAHSLCSRAISTNANRTVQIQRHRANLPCRGQSRCHSHRNYSTIFGVQRTKRPCCVYRTVLASQPPENHRQFNVMLTPKHKLFNSCGRHILSREIFPSPWHPCGVGLGVGSSKSMSTNSAAETVYYVLGKMIDSWPMELARQFFVGLHDTTGMPWWLVIISGTVFFRMALLPLNVITLQSQAKLTTIAPEIKNKSEIISGDAAAAGVFLRQKRHTVTRETRLLKAQMKRELYEKHNCSPFKPLLVVYVQVPVILTSGMALRSCAGHLGPLADKYFRPEMANEGFLWIPNLTVADPYFILPTIGFLCTVLSLEYSMLLRKVNHSQMTLGVTVVPEAKSYKFVNYLTRSFQGLATLLYPFLCLVPSSFTLYFSTISLWSVVQVLSLNTPSVKRALSVPLTKQDSPNPHTDVINAFRAKYLRHKEVPRKS